jgi:hypothetical protein
MEWQKITVEKRFITFDPGAKVINVFTVVIYCHSMVKLSFRVIKLYYEDNYRRMAVNCQGKKFYKIGP